MNSLKLQVPIGTTDCLPIEFKKKRHIIEVINNEFLLHGYDAVETPTFEYYEVFTHDSVPYTQENIIKFFDANGRILAMRPDMTGSIARMASTRLNPKDNILRLSYCGNVYGYKRGIRCTQLTQAGIELIGKHGPAGDAEVISIAIECLKKNHLENFTIDLGQVDYFKGLAKEAELDFKQTDRIRFLIDSKNNVELEYELSKLKIEKFLKQSFLQLINLFGDADILNNAVKMTDNDICLNAVENIREVYSILCDYGFSDYVSIDLGLLNDFNYYSGIIFRGLVNGVGHPILAGGRYDNLLSEFDADVPATGFAICIEDLMTALSKNNDTSFMKDKVIVVKCKPENRKYANEYINKMRQNGNRVILETDGYVYNTNDFEIEIFD